MAVQRELGKSLTAAEIQSLSVADMLKLVLDTDSPTELRRFAKARFAVEAAVQNDNHEAPFILWPVINRVPEAWLPVALAKVVRAEAPHTEKPQIIITIPSSAIWYGEHIREHHVFNGAIYPLVAKQKQISELNLDTVTSRQIAVPSYVHNRLADGQRGTQDMWFFTPELYAGAELTIIDDALAEGYTGLAIAKFAREELGVNSVYLGVPMTKAMQGGRERLLDSGLVDGISTLITVTETHGKGEPMNYE